MPGLIIGIDHGGTTTTAMALEPGRAPLASASVPMPKRTPCPGHVEHDAVDFLTTSLSAAHKALDRAGRGWQDVIAIGFANQGETSMAWSTASDDVFGPAISWEDRRTVKFCAQLAERGVDKLVRERTGILLDPYFSASRFHWLTHEVAGAAAARVAGRLRLGGTDSFVIDRLTRGSVHATDPATASRTALFDIRKRCWDADLLAAFDIDRAVLPEIRDTAGDFGLVRYPGLPERQIRIAADAVDAHAALFAQGCWDRSSVKATYGTGAFIEVNTGLSLVEPDGKLPVFVAWQIDGRADYALEGGVFSVGSAIDWAVRSGLLGSAAESAALAASVADSGGVAFVPSFTGLAAPYWVPTARACLFGLGLDSTRAHIARALLDGIAFCCAEVIRALDARLGGSLQMVKADGGPSRNPYLMQRQADLLGMPVVVSEESDMTALGAALLGAIGARQVTLDDVRAMPCRAKSYEPRISADERESAWALWRSSVASALERAKS
jgi:glycerol kinase